ncbi:hypothetical protein PFISCL1PPCAC_8857, partial [Pristionchus fissidentatus]
CSFKPKDPHGVNFGCDVLKSTLKALNIRLVVRGHRAMRNGFSMSFDNLFTLYSALSYTEQPKPGAKQAQPLPKNRGAVLSINEHGQMAFKILTHGGG